MSQHVMRVPIAIIALGARIPNNKFIPVLLIKLKDNNLLTN